MRWILCTCKTSESACNILPIIDSYPGILLLLINKGLSIMNYKLKSAIGNSSLATVLNPNGPQSRGEAKTKIRIRSNQRRVVMYLSILSIAAS